MIDKNIDTKNPIIEPKNPLIAENIICNVPWVESFSPCATTSGFVTPCVATCCLPCDNVLCAVATVYGFVHWDLHAGNWKVNDTNGFFDIKIIDFDRSEIINNKFYYEFNYYSWLNYNIIYSTFKCREYQSNSKNIKNMKELGHCYTIGRILNVFHQNKLAMSKNVDTSANTTFYNIISVAESLCKPHNGLYMIKFNIELYNGIYFKKTFMKKYGMITSSFLKNYLFNNVKYTDLITHGTGHIKYEPDFERSMAIANMNTKNHIGALTPVQSDMLNLYLTTEVIYKKITDSLRDFSASPEMPLDAIINNKISETLPRLQIYGGEQYNNKQMEHNRDSDIEHNRNDVDSIKKLIEKTFAGY